MQCQVGPIRSPHDMVHFDRFHTAACAQRMIRKVSGPKLTPAPGAPWVGLLRPRRCVHSAQAIAHGPPLTQAAGLNSRHWFYRPLLAD
jgi:hypothetical protein